jgi:hypothetical protein
VARGGLPGRAPLIGGGPGRYRPPRHRLSPPIGAHPRYRHLGEKVEGKEQSCGKSLIISAWHEDAKEAFGHGVRVKRSKAGAVSFEIIEAETGHASVQ